MHEKCDTSEILGIVTITLLTRSTTVELDADPKNMKQPFFFVSKNISLILV